MNLAGLLAERGRVRPGKAAVVFEGQEYTYAGFDDAVRRRALYLRGLGVKRGDRVALHLPKCMEFAFLHLAALGSGAVTLPQNTAYTPDEIRYFLTDSGSSVFFVPEGSPEALLSTVRGIEGLRVVEVPKGGLAVPDGPEDPRDFATGPDDPAILCYTSGTTGRSKGAVITHRNLVSNTAALAEAWRWREDDVLLHALPLYHVHGLCVALHGALAAGATTLMHERFDPGRCWETISRQRVTVFMGVPTMYHRMMNEWEAALPDLSRMRLFVSGSAPLPQKLFRRFEEATGTRILERYGMTECQMITSNPYDVARRLPGTVGYPLSDIALRVVGADGQDVAPGQPGEVWVRGPNVFSGYWRNPEKTRESFAEGGWFKTGDLGFLDPADDMRLTLAGRARELIISGGFNVYPPEIEAVIERHDAVREVAVFGLPDDDLGEKVAAAVVLRDNAAKPAPAELIAFARQSLAGYKCPRFVVEVDAIPKNSMGKIQKNVLQKKYGPSGA